MKLGVIADDYTGASDIASTLATGGLRTVQFLDVPSSGAVQDCDAGVVALKTRSIAAPEAIAQSLAALSWLQAQGCTQFVFKYCSTFDSTPQGNIGPVGEALAQALGVKGVVACPAFPATGRSVFQGHLFVGDRLLNESGLENHPLNPMSDPDLRRWLARQTIAPVGLVPHAVVARGPDAVRDALAQAGGRGEVLVIVDAVSDADLRTIGTACAGAALITGGSGIALGLPANLFAAGLAVPGQTAFQGNDGPAAILAGSCSRATLAQIAYHAKTHPVLAIHAMDVLSDRTRPSDIRAFMLQHAGRLPLVYSSADPAAVAALQSAYGRAHVAQAIETLFAEAAKMLVADGITRLVVAGGETSGAVVLALGLDALAVGRVIDPGVPALSAIGGNPAGGGRPLALALKSGNFGAEDFFAKAAKALTAA
jgi:3-dehydrotetronate 4-kinase